MIKDIKKDDRNEESNTLSRFLDLTHRFSNEYRTFLVKKCERLASALYVITGFIDAGDPVRIQLRESAINLITQSSHPHQSSPEAFGGKCAEIAALVETAKSGGLISQMNANLICDEYASVATFFSDHLTHITDHGAHISKDSLPIPKGLKGHVNLSSRQLMSLKDSSANGNKRQSDRKELIIKVITKKDNVSIKDITSEINGYSEKTIQRDLISLVRDGVLKREGERRWSTYRKATNGERNGELPATSI
ncbi:hypothetical protein A2841_00785 [Candidatus Kaiserbacteria bacterium RIFCSPHIGHO2_01_FULL_48_10]|uniref:HTH deoR-type domain-containing protein n=1 Tax=Candidatus Kaiserbacteria bacterium RIFCSPHIGHO2_01_FULL_48_10 TaxID=1798476 RepID=A0A1F6C6C5_9BACT|nr:MAG: hypothetical protein A2841_00785 [Candidatus Kaiserbacteria bacterium RIFCSPHIGHO2_01_FULL_48_10]